MTADQLAAITARNAARTQGTWRDGGLDHFGEDSWVRVIELACNSNSWPVIIAEVPANGASDAAARADTRCQADADFIAHASEDIPALLAEVKRLRTENAELVGILGDRVQDSDIAARAIHEFRRRVVSALRALESKAIASRDLSVAHGDQAMAIASFGGVAIAYQMARELVEELP